MFVEAAKSNNQLTEVSQLRLVCLSWLVFDYEWTAGKEWNEVGMNNDNWMNGNRQCWKDWLNAAIAVDEGSIKAWMND